MNQESMNQWINESTVVRTVVAFAMPQIYRTVITVKLGPMDAGRLWHQDNLMIKTQLNLYHHNLSIKYMFNPRKKHNLNANSELMSIYILTKVRYRTTNNNLMLLSPWDKSGMDMWQWHFINAIICAFYYFVSNFISFARWHHATPHAVAQPCNWRHTQQP